MSQSHNRRAACLLLAILFLGASGAISHSQTANDQDNVLTRVQAFLQVSYPELFGKGLDLNVRTTQPIDNTWRQIYDIKFDVLLYNPQSERMINPPVDSRTGLPVPPPKNTVLLRGSIWFDQEGRLNKFSVGDCALDHYKKNAAVRKLVESHPEWSEAQAFAALKKAGARFGPESKEELLKTIRLDKYEQFLGHFTVKSVEFVGLGQSHEGDFASLWWSIRVDAESPGGAHSFFSLIFEPFEGKLTEALHSPPAG